MDLTLEISQKQLKEDTLQLCNIFGQNMSSWREFILKNENN